MKIPTISSSQAHPTFKKQFTRGLFTGVFISVFSAFAGILLSRIGFLVIGHKTTIASGFFVIGTLLYLTIGFYNIRCPKCGKKTKTHTDQAKSHWLASCSNCNTDWDLEIGYQIK
jgi:hypothetical protein